VEISWQEYEWSVLLKSRADFGPGFRVCGTESGLRHEVVGRYSQVPRQLDVAVYVGSDQTPRFVVDAKRKLKGKADVKVVDAFVGMLDDLGVEGGALVCPHGWTRGAERRARAGKIRTALLSQDAALTISCLEIARRALPYDWAFVSEWAEALTAWRRGEACERVLVLLEELPYEEWRCFADYAMQAHPAEAVAVLEHAAQQHQDDCWRYNAAVALSEWACLKRLLRQSVVNREPNEEAREALSLLGVMD
jgi:hypothetical protein